VQSAPARIGSHTCPNDAVQDAEQEPPVHESHGPLQTEAQQKSSVEQKPLTQVPSPAHT
jgi:hypothetical protein